MSKSVKKTASKKTVAKAAAKAGAVKKAKSNARQPILGHHIIKVVKKENPFKPETGLYRNAAEVLAANGKTVEQAKAKHADSWTVRDLAARGLIKIVRDSEKAA